jgi:hypothetical protein
MYIYMVTRFYDDYNPWILNMCSTTSLASRVQFLVCVQIVTSFVDHRSPCENSKLCSKPDRVCMVRGKAGSVGCKLEVALS